jgi:CRP-like cAMP-binding protein
MGEWNIASAKEVGMTDDKQQFLASVRIFSDLDPDELALVAEVALELAWEPGEEVYGVGDEGSSMFVVREGLIELYGVAGGVERLFMTARPGNAFGLLSLIDPGSRPATARVAEPTTGFQFEGEDLAKLAEEHSAAGIKLFRALLAVLGERVRMLSNQYRDTVAWNLQVTGLASLNLEHLMSERVEVVVETLRGRPIQGTLVRFEQSAAGHELYLEDADKQIHLIPYHAIVRISVDRDGVAGAEDTPNL